MSIENLHSSRVPLLTCSFEFQQATITTRRNEHRKSILEYSLLTHVRLCFNKQEQPEVMNIENLYSSSVPCWHVHLCFNKTTITTRTNISTSVKINYMNSYFWHLSSKGNHRKFTQAFFIRLRELRSSCMSKPLAHEPDRPLPPRVSASVASPTGPHGLSVKSNLAHLKGKKPQRVN